MLLCTYLDNINALCIAQAQIIIEKMWRLENIFPNHMQSIFRYFHGLDEIYIL